MIADTSAANDAIVGQRLLDAVPLLLASCDASLRYTKVNRAYAARFGKKPADLVGRTMPETVGTEVFASIRPFIDRVLAGERVDTEATVTYPEVGPQTFRTVLTPVRDETGAVVGWDGVGENITARRAAEARLRDFAFLVHNTNDFVGMADLQFRPFFVNAAGMQMCGVTDPTALSVFDFVAPEHHAFLRDTYFPQVLRDGRASAELKFRNVVTGETFWMEYSVVRMEDASGAPTGYATISRSRDEHKRAEQRLRDADRQKDEFLGILAHELRNPLAPMTFAVASLERRVTDPAARKPLDVMARQVQRMSRLVDDLLDMSRIAQGKIELRREPVALASIMRGAVDAAAPALKQRRHTVELTVIDEVEVVGDAQRLGQVFDNLLGNAIKYTPDEGRIVVHLARDGSDARVSVRDSGIGIAPDVLPRIFDIFVQSEQSLDRSQGGLGIGLTLVDRLTRLHGGSVTASSAGLNQGAEFVVRLPLRHETTEPGGSAVSGGRASSATF